MRTKIISIAIIAVIALFGCKKNVTDQQNIVPDNVSTQKLQAWYAKATALASANSFSAPKTYTGLAAGKPDWNKTTYSLEDKSYTIPIAIGSHGGDGKTTALKYLVAQEDAKGDITGGKYIVVLLKNTEAGAASEKDITSKVLSLKTIPNNFTGAMIEYDFTNIVTASHYYEGGKLVISQDNATGKGMVVNNNMPLPECNGQQACIDWYWQHYVNGELIWEEYLYTTCECYGGGSGGGGTSTNCQDALNAFVDQGHAFDGQMSKTNTSSTGITWEIPYNWVIFTAGTWGMVSYEKGLLEKVTYPNMTRWEFVSLTHLNTSEIGMSIGGTRTFQLNSAVPNISSSRTSAQMIISFTITHKVCAIAPLSMTYQSVGKATAPNSVVVVPE